MLYISLLQEAYLSTRGGKDPGYFRSQVRRAQKDPAEQPDRGARVFSRVPWNILAITFCNLTTTYFLIISVARIQFLIAHFTTTQGK